MKKIVRPDFANEREEAEWWDANPEYIRQQFELAKAEGRLGHGPVVQRTDLTTPVTLRISQGDLAAARAQSKEKGVGYQTYMKMLLHEALSKNQKETVSPSRRGQRQAQRPVRKQSPAAARRVA